MPGDTITVRTISTESFEYPGLLVDSEGKVNLPMAGPVDIHGLGVQAAEKKMDSAHKAEMKKDDKPMESKKMGKKKKKMKKAEKMDKAAEAPKAETK